MNVRANEAFVISDMPCAALSVYCTAVDLQAIWAKSQEKLLLLRERGGDAARGVGGCRAQADGCRR